MNNFEDGLFEIVFDKGTIDALLSDFEITIKVLREMARVMNKEKGKIIIVSYGTPSERFNYFNESIGFDNYEYFVCKKLLSPQSQLINLLRN